MAFLWFFDYNHSTVFLDICVNETSFTLEELYSKHTEIRAFIGVYITVYGLYTCIRNHEITELLLPIFPVLVLQWAI